MVVISSRPYFKMNCSLLYLVGQLGVGGLERQLCFLLQGMNRERYRPEVVVWNFRSDDAYVPYIQKLGVPLHALPTTAPAWKKLSLFRQTVVQRQPEVIHSFTFYTNVAAWWAALGTKRVVAIGAVRSNFTYDKRSCGFWLGSLSARWPRAQIYNNSAGANKARHSRSPFRPRQVFVVRNGLDLEHFRNVPLPPNGQIRILGVGSLLRIKRWDRLLRAAASLKKSGIDFLVEIAGSGPLRESLEQQAADLGLVGRVELIGHRNDIPGLIARSSFLVHTSDVEGYPNVVMEAMACGRAVVATDAGDIPSLVEDGKTGFVVCREDEAKLVERLATLITDRDLCQRMGKAGRAKAEREFGADRLVSETFAAYKAAGWKGW